MGEGARVELAPERKDVPPLVDLDTAFYRLLGDFEPRFARGAPSLVGCERLKVIGDVAFGAGVVARGSVLVENRGGSQLWIDDGAFLSGV